MKLQEAIEILGAEAHYTRAEQLEAEIRTARASDLMSEVLAEDAVPDLLITGLCNAQVIRTASVFGIKAVIFVRGKTCNPKMIDLAMEENVVVMTTPDSLFSSCGKLYGRGVRGVYDLKN
jgi:hypothetical protein